MTQRTNRLTLVEQILHGALLGALVGVISAALEYALLVDAFSGDLVKAYWKIVLPYGVLGVAAGLAIAIVLAVVQGAPAGAGRSAGRLLAWLVAVSAVLQAAVWILLWLGPPVVRMATIGTLVGIALGAIAAGLLLQHLLSAALARLDTTGPGTRMTLPVAASALTAVVLLLPVLYLARPHSVAPVTASPVAGQDRPNVLFILIDALRPDHLPMYGYSRPTAPNLSALAARGVTFTNAYAQASYTRASVATILTSLYPSVHRANDDRDFLTSAAPVLPERLRAAGYTTYGISSNANVSPTFGYSRGFDEFRVWKTESEFRLTAAGRVLQRLVRSASVWHLLGESADIVPTADAITDATLAWVAAEGSRQPFFMYVHYIDPHDPYRPPAPYDTAFDHRKDPPRRRGVDPLALAPAGVDRAVLGRTLDQYDGETLFADHHVGRLLQALEERGLLRNTLVIVTADHGEEFFDHGEEIHGRSVYEEVLRVPLIAAWPGKIPAGTRSESRVGHIDLMPTILEVAGGAAPAGVQGRSLAPLLRDPAAAWAPRPLLAQVFQKSFALEAILDGPHKYIRHTRGPKAGREELYDLAADPLERRNLADEARARVASLRKSLDAFNEVLDRTASAIPAEQAQKLDKDTERALRSLGYIK